MSQSNSKTMSLQRGYKYRIYPTKEQHTLLMDHCFNANQAYNILVSMNRQQYQYNKSKLPNVKQDKKLNVLSTSHLSEHKQYLTSTYEDDIIKHILRKRNLHNINTKVLQQTRMLFNTDLQKKLKNINILKEEYYKKEKLKQKKDQNYKIKKFELFNYKKSGSLGYNSFQTTKEQYTLMDTPSPKFKILRLFSNDIKIRWTRELISDLKTITITKQPNNEWYISFSQTLPINFNVYSQHNNNNSMGLDLNIGNITLSDGKRFPLELKNKSIVHKNIKLMKLKQRQSKRLEVYKKQCQLATKSKEPKPKLTKNYYHTQHKINRLHAHNTNIQEWNLHQLVNSLVGYMKMKNVTKLKMEKLNVKEMTSKTQDIKNNNKNKIGKHKSKAMRKNILCVSFSKLQQILCYKCVQIGIDVEFVDSAYTSKTCHHCGEINHLLTLKSKYWQCEHCHTIHDRDHNASININNK